MAASYTNDYKLMIAGGTSDADSIINLTDPLALDISVTGEGNTISGGNSADKIIYNGSKASIVGGAGDDTIDNNGSSATILGGSGNDSIKNTGALAVIVGGDGDDTLYAGNGSTLSGGDGNDVFVYTKGDGNSNAVAVTDYRKLSDSELDIIKIDGGGEITSVTNDGEDVKVAISSGDLILKNAKDKPLHFKLAAYDSIYSSKSDTTIDGSEVNDYITSTGSKNLICTGEGINSIRSTGEYNTIVSGSAVDYATLASNNLYKYAGGNDVISSYNDTATIQVVNSMDVSDLTKVTVAADTSATNNVKLTIDGDVVSLVGATGKRINVLDSNGSQMTGFIVKSTQASDTTVVIYNIQSTDVARGDTDDYVVNYKEGAKLALGAGDDTYELAAPNSYVQYTSGADIVIGFDSTDKVSLAYGPAGTSPFIGGRVDGNDVIIYTNEEGIDSDTLTLKSVKTQTVNVTRDNDQVLTALNGNITLHGATNKDIFYYKAGNGNQTIVGYDGYDSIVTSTDTSVTNAAVKSNNVILAIGSSSLTVKDGASNRLNIVGYGAQEYGDKNIEIENGDGDTINATLNASVVTIDGATSRTTSVYLVGNKNNNKILGTEKVSSTLHGGTGNDTLTGGTASDTFIYSAGKDVITDYFGYTGDLSSTVDAARYATDTDVIQLSTGSISTYSISGQDVTFTIGSGSLTVKNGKNKKITFLNADGTVNTDTTKVYRSTTEFIVTDDDLTSLMADQSVSAGTADVPAVVTVTAADTKVTLIDSNLELKNSSDTSLKFTNLYITGNAAANTLKASRYGNDTLSGGSSKADTLVGSGSVIETVTSNGSSSTVEVGGSDTYLYQYGQGKDVIVNYKEADQIFFTSTDTTLTGSTLKSGNITFTVTDLKGKNKSTFVVRDVADKKITFANENGELYSQIFGTTSITVGDDDLSTVNTKPNTAVKNINASSRTEEVYIIGTAKANSIVGGKGDVTLQGGAGKDTLTRSDGSHTTFAFGSNEGTANVVTSYVEGSDTIRVLSGAHTATATIKNSNDLTFTIGKTKVRVKDAKGKAITFVDALGTETTQIYGVASINVANKDADENATINTAANSTVVTIDSGTRDKAVYISGNKKNNVIVASLADETIATAAGKDTVQINSVNDSKHLIITDYAAGKDKLELASGVYISAATTLKAGQKITGTDDTVAADSVILTLTSDTGAATLTSTLVVEGAITTSKKGVTTNGKLTIIDDTKGITYSQAFGGDSIAVANADGATVDTANNTNVKYINAKKRTSKVMIYGNAQVNSIYGGTKADTIYAGSLGGTIDGAAGNDWIFGDIGNSDTSVSVNGGKGNDTIIAGLGKNTLAGGKGNDVFVFEVKSGQGAQGGMDTILDFATGNNTLVIESGTTLWQSSLQGNDTYITLKGASESDYKAIKFTNTKDKKIAVLDKNTTTPILTKQTYGSATLTVANGDADTIDANASYNSAVTTINAKKITKKGIYLISNDENNSYVIGGTKGDTIKSGKGSNALTGGKGNDVFIYSGAGNDTITDYSLLKNNSDVLQFANGSTPTYYHVEGKNVVLEFSDTAAHAVTTNTLTIVNGKDKKLVFNGWTPTFGTLDSNFDGVFDDYTELVLSKSKSQSEAKTGTNSLDYRTTYINASKNSSAINIFANNSDSTIIASAKADQIIGGSRDDLITTGKGKDTISISGGKDTITDYTTGSDVIHLNGYTIKSSKVSGDAVVFTTEKTENGVTTTGELRVGGAVSAKKGTQKITIYDNVNNRTTSQVYAAANITIGGSDGDVFDLSSDVNSNVTKADASKRKSTQSIRIISGSKSTELIGGSGNDTLIGGNGGGVLTGGAGADSLIGGSGTTVFNPGKGNDIMTISTVANRGKATVNYTAGDDKVTGYKSTDSISLASGVKVKSAKQNSKGYTFTFNKGELAIELAEGQNLNDVFTVSKTASSIKGTAETVTGGSTVYNWTVNCYVKVSGISNALFSTTTVQKVATASAATLATEPAYEERFEYYEEPYDSLDIFDDTVLASADDLTEITSSTVDEAAIAVNLTPKNALTDFKLDTELLTTITQKDKDKK